MDDLLRTVWFFIRFLGFRFWRWFLLSLCLYGVWKGADVASRGSSSAKPVRRELHVALLSLRIASTAMSTSTNYWFTSVEDARRILNAWRRDFTTPYDLTVTEKPHPGAVCHAAPEHRSFPGTPLPNRRPSQKTAGADGEGDLGSAGAHLECASPTRKRPRVRKSDPTNWSGSFPEPNAYIIFFIIF